MLVDTHTHLYLDEFSADRMETVQRAIDSGVEKMIFPNVDLSTLEPMKQLHAQFPQHTYMAIGLHPTEVNADWQSSLQTIHDEFEANPQAYVAIGEIGIDLYWDKTFRAQQMEVFGHQIEWANAHNLPIIIHCREGLDDVLEVIRGAGKVPRGVFHSFGGTIEDVDRIREVGDFYFGINGIVTFKNSRLSSVLPHIGTERILLETDSPYLAPVPKRGKRNESSYIVHTADFVASSLGCTSDELQAITTRNAADLFDLA